MSGTRALDGSTPAVTCARDSSTSRARHARHAIGTANTTVDTQTAGACVTVGSRTAEPAPQPAQPAQPARKPKTLRSQDSADAGCHGLCPALYGSSMPAWRFWVLSIGICLGLFLAMLDMSIVATSLFQIGQDLGDIGLLNWIALSYILAYLGCAVLSARSADVIGRRNAYLAAFVVFLAFSLGCGFSQTMHQLVVCRTLQGVGGSGLFSLSMIMLPEVAPRNLQPHIAALTGFVVAMSGVLGPVLGGLFTLYVSWRWIFWVNGPLAVVSMAIFTLSWPSAEHLPEMQRRSWKQLDFLGSFLLLAAAVLVTFSFQIASTQGTQWREAVFIAPFSISILCWSGLFAWEWHVERRWPHMMAAVPMKLVRNHVYTSALIHTMMIAFSFFTITYAFPIRLQVVNGESSFMAGVMLLPMLAGASLGSFVSGTICVRFNRPFEVLVAASILVSLGCGLESTLSNAVSLQAKALGFLPLVGIGSGLTAAAATILASAEAPEGEHTSAQGLLAQMRVLGGSMGIAASSAVLASQQMAKMGEVISTTADTLVTPPTPGMADLIYAAFADAFREDMRICAAIAAVSIFAACGTYRRNRGAIFQAKKQDTAKQPKEAGIFQRFKTLRSA